MMLKSPRHIYAALGQALLLILLYRDLEVPMPLRLLSLALFGLSCWWRPDTGLALVTFTTPLYLIPVSLSGILSHEIHFPLNEMALMAMLPFAGARWLREDLAQRPIYDLRFYLPHGLFLVAGVLGVVLALPGSRDDALRELRWLIIEPLLFYGLLRRFGRLEEDIPPVVWGLSLAAAGVAFLGLMQFIGHDLVPPLGWKRTFSENVTMVGELRRVASVYGHPNNLGLFLERCWPLALAAALLARQRQHSGQIMMPLPYASREAAQEVEQLDGEPSRSVLSSSVAPILLVFCVLLSLGGLAVSFSRGAWLGSFVAAGVLAAGIWGFGSAQRDRERLNSRLKLGLALLLLASSLGLAAMELRGGGGSESTRLLLWREALGYIGQHPLGIGLDQFYAYHLPGSGHSLIAPSLIGTSEEHAAHPHNLVLDIWLRLGPLGLVAFGWLFVRFYRRAMPNSQDVLLLGAMAAMAAGLVHGLVDHFYFVPDIAFVFWTLIAMSDGQTARRSDGQTIRHQTMRQ